MTTPVRTGRLLEHQQPRKKRRLCSPSFSLLFPPLLVLLAFWNLYVGIQGTTPMKNSTTTQKTTTFDKKYRQQRSDNASPNQKDTTTFTYDSSSLSLIDTATTTARNEQQRSITTTGTPTHKACHGYAGIYHIAMGDIGGAAGTIFFQFVIGQILYAEQNSLLPWVHLNNVSYIVYDPVVHGAGPGVHLSRLLVGRNATWVRRPGGHMKDIHPGPLDVAAPVTHVDDLHFPGTGVWNHYFEPVSQFVPGDTSCFNKLYVTLDLYLITPGIHGFSEWAPKCWRYKYLPDYVTKPHIPLQEWLEPQRAIAHRVVQQYIRFKPEIQQAAERVNPDCASATAKCLGLHIRQSDKAAGRRVVATHEFLPYAQAFVLSGGQHIYVATDSDAVLQEIIATWPEHVTSRIRTAGSQIVRSNNTTAVFDMGISRHRTNQEVLVEILALSCCHYMIHGLSAVSESSIWINLELHARSVNLEDPDHLTPAAFGALVQMDQRRHGDMPGDDLLPRPLRTDPWWDVHDDDGAVIHSKEPTHHACDGFDGVLRISSVARQAGAGRAFFISVLNQLLYAERHNLKPWVHLRSDSATVSLIYDPKFHNKINSSAASSSAEEILSFDMIHGMAVTVVKDEIHPRVFYPGNPAKRAGTVSSRTFQVTGNGIWESYFEPVSDFVPGDLSCRDKPLIEMEPQLVDPGLDAYAEWTVRSWRYDDVPNKLWIPKNSKDQLQHLYQSMRKKASEIVRKYVRLKPHITERASKVNPVSPKEGPCLGVHVRSIDKQGKYREKVDIRLYVSYMQAFVRAGGRAIYLATDSLTVIQHLFNSYPDLAKVMRTQGTYVVRSSKGRKKEWSPHFVEGHHRVNSEALVESLALSKCALLIHGFSTLSEAAIYLNPALHQNSVNLESPIMTAQEFESFVQEHIGNSSRTVVDAPRKYPGVVLVDRMDNATILRRPDSTRACRANAIVYLAQKVHSSYGRDSYANLLRSLDLLKTNYLSIGEHLDNVDLFLFHTGDFSEKDLLEVENRLGSDYIGVIRLVDLSGSPYWARPKHHSNDDPKDWYAWPLFSEGYRRMIHWYAIDLWEFFGRWNLKTSDCNYKYIFRLDEDSFIHSPIRYDIFELMGSRNLTYGFRMCAYEMQVARRMWKWWSERRKDFAPYRELDLNMCGFYNNFFVADLDFFLSPNVKAFLRFIDRQGHIYRRRLGDLMIHSMAVYAFALPEHIHRFVDFTYEHSTVNETNGCVIWGGIQAGSDDVNASATLGEFYRMQALRHVCPVNSYFLGAADLSPTYLHLDARSVSKLSLHTITAGNVELPGKGPLSG